MLNLCSAIVFFAISRFVVGEVWGEDDFVHFVTEPSIRSYRTRIIVEARDPSVLQPGYIFYSPFARVGWKQVGPHIIDQDGELVWYGNDTVSQMIQNFHPCNWLGTTVDHLCMSYHFYSDLGHVQAEHHVLDSSYSSVTSGLGAVSGADLRFPNPHEFEIVQDGKSYLQAIYQLRSTDLSAYGGPEDGYFEEGCFQEVDIASGSATFSWCAAAHDTPVWHSYIFLPGNIVNDTGESYGKGTLNFPWDPFHINSVHKNPEGDYFISLRHMDTVLKVAGGPTNVHGVAPGTVLWRLGGKANQFADVGRADLSRQHDVRFLSATENETTFSVFNNQFRAIDRSLSNGQIVTINNSTKTVISARKFYNPEGLVSQAMGSMQVLPNGNVLVGWGTIPQFTEYGPDGTLLFHAHLDKYDAFKGMHNIKTYRVYKSPWIGKPLQPPKVVLYSRTCTTDDKHPLIAYVSWNGATEHTHWRIHTTSMAPRHGPWLRAGTFRKQGFETKIYIRGILGGRASFARYAKVEALDRNGEVLATVFAETFVPTPDLARTCNADGCGRGFEYRAVSNCAGDCFWAIAIWRVACGGLVVFVLACAVGAAGYFMRKLRGGGYGDKWKYSRLPQEELGKEEGEKQGAA